MKQGKAARSPALRGKRTGKLSQIFMKVEQLERSTNGLKGQMPKKASPIKCPAIITPVHWTTTKQVHCMWLLMSNQRVAF